MVTPKFAPHSFHADLKKRINQYFKDGGIAPTGNYKLFLKAGILVTLFVFFYVHLVFFTPQPLIAIIECVAFWFYRRLFMFQPDARWCSRQFL